MCSDLFNRHSGDFLQVWSSPFSDDVFIDVGNCVLLIGDGYWNYSYQTQGFRARLWADACDGYVFFGDEVLSLDLDRFGDGLI